jgi:methyl-accepting chemotaxis protein
MYTRSYTLYGVLFGVCFPAMGAVIEAMTRHRNLPLSEGLAAAFGAPLMWVICLAPPVLGMMAFFVGRRQDEVLEIARARREEVNRTARELFASAQALLSSVSAFSSVTAETAASVRETTATMGQLAQTATRAALTAETVIGVAQGAGRTAQEGVGAAEASQGEMGKMAAEVRGLSRTIEALNARMRDIFEVASVVNYIADRSQRLAESAATEVERAGSPAPGLQGVVGEMRHHAEDAKRAALQVKAILGEVHKAMLAAMTGAELGVRRAEQSAQVAAGTGDSIRRLASALQESSLAARDIATVAQQ